MDQNKPAQVQRTANHRKRGAKVARPAAPNMESLKKIKLRTKILFFLNYVLRAGGAISQMGCRVCVGVRERESHCLAKECAAGHKVNMSTQVRGRYLIKQ